jgi:hypothetical protein
MVSALTSTLPIRGAEPEAPRALHGIDEIRAGVAASRARLRSLLVEYRMDGHSTGASGFGTSYSQHMVAASGPLRFTDNVHWNDVIPRELDLNHHQVYYDEKTLDVFYQAYAIFETSRRGAGRRFSWKARGPFFLECLAWWPPDDSSPPEDLGRPFFLHEALARDVYRVLPLQEQADGAWCHVVEAPGEDKIWFDASIGFAMRRRECFAAKSGVRNGVFELSDYRQAEPGIWIPWRVYRTLYDTTGVKRGGAGRVAVAAGATVVRVEVNRACPVKPPYDRTPGVLVHDLDAATLTQVPGGLEVMNQVIDIAQQHAIIGATPDRLPRSPAGPSWWGWALVAVIGGLVSLNLSMLFGLLRSQWPSRVSTEICRG